LLCKDSNSLLLVLDEILALLGLGSSTLCVGVGAVATSSESALATFGLSAFVLSVTSSVGEEVEISGRDKIGFEFLEVDTGGGRGGGDIVEEEAEEEDFFLRFFLSFTDFEAEEVKVEPRECTKGLKVGTDVDDDDDDGDDLVSPPLRIKRAHLF
jgi:hypothetical protein